MARPMPLDSKQQAEMIQIVSDKTFFMGINS